MAAGAGAGQRAELAIVPRPIRIRRRRRYPAGLVGFEPIHERRLDCGDPRPRALEPGGLERSHLRDRTRIYQQRVSPAAAGFSASPVAAAGRIYLASEDGDVFVVRAGRTFELLATNHMGEVLMATPALTGDMIVVRTQTRLVGLRQS
jgi:hypothetical protein